ncbi:MULTISPECIES: hypothetical protein [unclassified Bradyrhizobium]|nr:MULTISPECIES: hypothetical protein [unclassified Bradyrhizobium]
MNKQPVLVAKLKWQRPHPREVLRRKIGGAIYAVSIQRFFAAVRPPARRRSPRDVDLMLMDGSTLGRLADDATFPSEEDLEETFAKRFEQTEGFAWSPARPEHRASDLG